MIIRATTVTTMLACADMPSATADVMVATRHGADIGAM